MHNSAYVKVHKVRILECTGVIRRIEDLPGRVSPPEQISTTSKSRRLLCLAEYGILLYAMLLKRGILRNPNEWSYETNSVWPKCEANARNQFSQNWQLNKTKKRKIESNKTIKSVLHNDNSYHLRLVSRGIRGFRIFKNSFKVKSNRIMRYVWFFYTGCMKSMEPPE